MKMSAARGRGRVILTRDTFPYFGGSSTLLYLLFERLQRSLPDAECWNILNPKLSELGQAHYGLNWSNPKNLPNVRTFILDGRKGSGAIRRALRERPVAGVLSKSRKTTAFLKDLVPSIPMWHLTSTCSLIKNAIAADLFFTMEEAIRHLRKNDFPRLKNPEESHAVRSADKILFHTENMRFWYYTFYPQCREKMEEEIFWDYPTLKREFHRLRPKTVWAKRPIDLLFAASDWKRPEKNFPFLKRLCRVFRSKKIVVIGFLPEKLSPSVITLEAMRQEEVVEAMMQAKVVVCPSRYDEAPNVLFEAVLAGANIVCSKNCGNYGITPPPFVAELTVPDFISKIKRALKAHRLPHQTELFTENDLSRWILKQVAAQGKDPVA